MAENFIIPDPYKPILEAIENVPYFWAEYKLPDHPDLPQFNRKLVVSGFNSPDLMDQNDERLYISIRQILTNKETGKIFKIFNAPQWEIFAHTWSYLRNSQFQSIEVDKQILDDESGEVLSTEKSKIKVSTIKYFKTLLKNREAHLVDLLNAYMGDFAAVKIDELNRL